jgi:hypothetical protein
MRIISACLLLTSAVALGGCGYTPEQRATSGAAIGAGTGAVIAAAAGAGPGAVIASSILGAGAGALIGANTRPPRPRPVYYIAPPPPGARRCVEFAEDIYGRRYCRAYYGS